MIDKERIIFDLNYMRAAIDAIEKELTKPNFIDTNYIDEKTRKIEIANNEIKQLLKE